MNAAIGRAVLGVLLLLGMGCEAKKKVVPLRKPTVTPVALDGGIPEGVRAELALDHFVQATFADITTLVPEKEFAGVCVEGNTFEVPGDVYLLRLTLRNDSSRDLILPELRVRRPNGTVGAEEVVYAGGKRTLASRAGGCFIYLWDPGLVLPPGTSARLVWSR